MVWTLIPADSLRGAQKYYIFSEGTYHVGRKDCDIIVQTDTSISRNHADIVVNKMTSSDPSCTGSDKFPSCVRIIDKSKYGTFISKESESKAVRLVKNNDAVINEGDYVTFGTSNATFRFCHVAINVFVHASKGTQLDQSFQATISSIGARSSCSWNHECTHVLVDESSPITVDLIEAIVAKKPIVLVDWYKVLAEKSIRTEFPSCIPYAPTLTLEGTSIRIVDPTIREKCLEGFTFVLGSLSKLKFGEKFRLLLEVVGAKFISAEDFCSDSQTSADGEKNYILVLPRESPNELNTFRVLSSLSRITDLKLAAAILSGSFDSSMLEQPAIVVSSSHSTDETIVADSDVEMDTATSNVVAATSKSQDAIKYGDQEAKKPGDIEDTNVVAATYKSLDAIKHEDQEANKTRDREDTTKHQESKKSTDYLNTSSDKIKISCSREGVASMKKLDKGDESFSNRHENSDIIFSQDLIVRDIIPVPVQSTRKNVANFKCFRKGKTMSGNSFRDLIPFSKDPYKESEYGSNQSDCMREEKKQKQLEAIAEDLFNNEKSRKRAVVGASMQSFLARC